MEQNFKDITLNLYKKQTQTDVNKGQILGFNAFDFIDQNTFATTHQSVNVYVQPEKKYEIRCEDTAVDVQVNEG